MLDFQLAAIDTVTKATTGVQMPIKKLDGEPLLNKKGEPVFLVLKGTDSDDYTAATRAVTRARIARAADRTGDGPPTDQELDAGNADGIGVLAKMTSGWGGFLDSDDKPLAFSTAAVLELYERYPVVRDQAEVFVNTRSHFTAA